ncbi:MAG: hypothetical protein ACI4BH_06770, partial [Muribaculaceae bacterium]
IAFSITFSNFALAVGLYSTSYWNLLKAHSASLWNIFFVFLIKIIIFALNKKKYKSVFYYDKGKLR